MAGKLSPSAQVRLATLKEFTPRVQHVYGLVELFASAPNPEQYALPLGRAFGRLKLQLMGVGLDPLSQLCGAMEIASKRGLSHGAKSRILREGVGSLKFQLELELRAVVTDDAAAARKKESESEAG